MGKRERGEEEAEEEEMGEGNTSVTKLDLPPERQEHQKFVDHNIWLANHTELVVFETTDNGLNRWIIPQADEEAEKSYPDMGPESALEEILDER